MPHRFRLHPPVCVLVAQVWPHRPIAFDFDSLRLRLTKQDLQARIIAEMNNHYTTTCTPPEDPGVRWMLQCVSAGRGRGRVYGGMECM